MRFQSFVSCKDPEIFIRGPGAESSDRYFRCVCGGGGVGGCQYMESIHVATITCDFPGGGGQSHFIFVCTICQCSQSR